MARIVLASGSPRRQELLTRIGIRDFTVRVPQVEEWYPQGLTPPEIVSYISREKSQAVPSEEDVTLAPGQRLGIPTGIAIALPSPDYVALVFVRSGMGFKHGIGLSNGVGVIDSDYRGEISVGLMNPRAQVHGRRSRRLILGQRELPAYFRRHRLDFKLHCTTCSY